MKNYKSLSFGLAYLFMLLICTASAQSDQYLHSSIDIEVGAVKMQDYTSVRPFNVEIGYRYMATPIVGAKLSLNYTRIYEQWDFAGYEEPIQFRSATLMGVVNIGRIAQMEDIFNNKITILTGIGGNLSHSTPPVNNSYFFRTTNFHLATFADIELKVSKRVFLRTGVDMVGGINVDRDNFPGETTNQFNFNVGATIALGNGKKEHADWYIRPQKVDTVMLQPTIIDKTVTNNPIVNNYNTASDSSDEYVYFKHDSAVIDKDGLANIEKAINKGTSFMLIGYCSNVGSYEYNIKLAQKRMDAIMAKMSLLGRFSIQTKVIGIDTERQPLNYDMARRVVIEVTQ